MTLNIPPWGSWSKANRPAGTSISGMTRVPPSSCAFAAVASASSTAKYTSQNGGTSAGTIGGMGSIPGAVLGALLVGVGEEMSLLLLAPVYKSAVGFVAILLVLTFRPSGLLGLRAA